MSSPKALRKEGLGGKVKLKPALMAKIASTERGQTGVEECSLRFSSTSAQGRSFLMLLFVAFGNYHAPFILRGQPGLTVTS